MQSCYSPIASASAAAPRLRPLPAAAPRLRPLQLPIASANSAAARRLRPLQLLLPIASASAAASRLPTAAPRLHAYPLAAPAGFQPQLDSSPIYSRTFFAEFVKYEGRTTLYIQVIKNI